jgi:hypothetical protein
MEKRGLSAVVTTLIIILLVLVAVGIVWVVVRDVVETGAEKIDVSTRCLDVGVEAVEVVPVEGEDGNYTVTLHRKAGGEEINGIKLNIFNETNNTGVLDFGIALGVLDTNSAKIEANLINANKIEFTPYILDASGIEHFCTTETYNF